MTIDTKEIKESFRTGDVTLSNERDLLATLENFTSITRVDSEIHVLIGNIILSSNPDGSKEIRFCCVASVFTPHVLKVDCTNWTIIKEHSIESLVVTD